MIQDRGAILTETPHNITGSHSFPISNITSNAELQKDYGTHSQFGSCKLLLKGFSMSGKQAVIVTGASSGRSRRIRRLSPKRLLLVSSLMSDATSIIS